MLPALELREIRLAARSIDPPAVAAVAAVVVVVVVEKNVELPCEPSAPNHLLCQPAIAEIQRRARRPQLHRLIETEALDQEKHY